MGIDGQDSIVWKSIPISFDNIIFLLESHSKNRQQQRRTDSRRRPKISIDVSIIAHNLEQYEEDPADGLKLIARSFADRGLDVILDVDGPSRHRSNRATRDRSATQDRAQIQLLQVRSEDAQIINIPNETSNTKDKKKEPTEKIRKLEKAAKKGLPNNLLLEMEKLAKSYHNHNHGTTGSTITVGSSLRQADPAITRRSLNGEIDAILSGGSDLSMCIGVGGPDGMGDMVFQKPRITTTDGLRSLEIRTGQKAVAEYVTEILGAKIADGQKVFEEPPYPVFDSLVGIRSRALLAVALGCDVLPGGIPGFGPTKACEIKARIDWTNLDKADDTLVEELVTASSTAEPRFQENCAKILTKDAFLCLSNSLMSYGTTNDDDGRATAEPPIRLEDPNKEPAVESVGTISGPAAATCQEGCTSGPKPQATYATNNAPLLTPLPSKKQQSSNTATKRKRKRKRCCAQWCNNAGNEGMISVPKCPEKPYSRNGMIPSLEARKSWHIKRFKRNEFTDRLGLGRKRKISQDLRFCSDHPMEWVNGKTICIALDGGGGQSIQVPPFLAPVPIDSTEIAARTLCLFTTGDKLRL